MTRPIAARGSRLGPDGHEESNPSAFSPVHPAAASTSSGGEMVRREKGACSARSPSQAIAAAAAPPGNNADEPGVAHALEFGDEFQLRPNTTRYFCETYDECDKIVIANRIPKTVTKCNLAQRGLPPSPSCLRASLPSCASTELVEVLPSKVFSFVSLCSVSGRGGMDFHCLLGRAGGSGRPGRRLCSTRLMSDS